MSYKGSIVVKRTELLDWIEDASDMFRTMFREDSRQMAFGQRLALISILNDNYIKFKHNEDVQKIWSAPSVRYVTPGEIWSMIVGAEE